MNLSSTLICEHIKISSTSEMCSNYYKMDNFDVIVSVYATITEDEFQLNILEFVFKIDYCRDSHSKEDLRNAFAM